MPPHTTDTCRGGREVWVALVSLWNILTSRRDCAHAAINTATWKMPIGWCGSEAAAATAPWLPRQSPCHETGEAASAFVVLLLLFVLLLLLSHCYVLNIAFAFKLSLNEIYNLCQVMSTYASWSQLWWGCVCVLFGVVNAKALLIQDGQIVLPLNIAIYW